MEQLVSPDQLELFGKSVETQIVENFGHVVGKQGYENFEDWSIELGDFKGRTQIKMSRNKLEVFVCVYYCASDLLNVVCVKEGKILTSKTHELKIQIEATDVMDEVVNRMNNIAGGFNLLIYSSDMFQ